MAIPALSSIADWPRRLSSALVGNQGSRARSRRVRTPHILQMEAVECGAAALAMILGYYERFAPLEELRVACGVSRDGSKASNILKAARKYGLVAKGFKKEPEQVRDLPLPLIAHWNFNHFLVVEGFARAKVFLNDPASGPRVVTPAEFDQAFTGVVLTFAPDETFVRGGERAGLLKPLARRLVGLAPAVGFVVLAGVALLVPGLVAPTFSRTFVDQVLVKGLYSWLHPLLLAMAGTALMSFALSALQQHYLLRLESRLSLGMSSRFFWHVLRLPLDFFNQRYAGEIGNRVAINDRVARLLSGELATTLLNFMVIVLYATLMLQYDIVLSSVSVLTVILNVAALRYVSERRSILSQRMLQDRGKLMGTAMSGLQTIETLKAGGSESDFFSRWAGHQAKLADSSQALMLTTQSLGVVPPLLMAVNTALILGLGGLRVMDGHLSMGMLIAFQALTYSFLGPVNRLLTLGGQLEEVQGGMNRLDDVLRAAVDPTTNEAAASGAEPGAAAASKLDGSLELRRVTFGYSRLDPPLIEGFDLTLRPGERVALVGGSGSGKSTVAKLVAGLYEPWDGEVLFDGRPRRAIQRNAMALSVGVVDQDISMFEGTIRDNLAMWDSTVLDHDLVEAARDACIHDDISSRPGGYGAPIEEGGRNFSGGQRQRLEIARALVVSPRLLVLDEATSALDPLTEKLIDENLRRRGCTCLIVAHRLSTIRDCDEIVVLERGKVVQRGTHSAMLAAGGAYARLIATE